MRVLEKDIKLLWGRAASRCNVCRCELTHDKKAASEAFPLGEQAHIIAEENLGPRGKSILTREERNCYHNLILLCPTCHVLVDKNIEDYPPEKLHFLKSSHELWVQGRLSGTGEMKNTTTTLVYEGLIDAIVKHCRLDDWKNWSYSAMSGEPKWPVDFKRSAHELRRKVATTIWPGRLPELEKAIQTLSLTFQSASEIFIQHCRQWNEDELIVERFYKCAHRGQWEYRLLIRHFEDWCEDFQKLVLEVAKSANWVADVARKYVNPMFFVEEGKFIIESEWISNLSHDFDITAFEYSEEERGKLPELFTNQRKKAEKKRIAQEKEYQNFVTMHNEGKLEDIF